MEQSQIVKEIFIHCKLNDVPGAVQGAVRLARLEGDPKNLSYFLLELGLARGDALESFSNAFPHYPKEYRQKIFEVSFERLMRVHEVSEYHRTVLGYGEAVKIFYVGASTIDSELNDARALAIELKSQEICSDPINVSNSFWKLRQQADAKVAVISRIRSLMIANCFEYASQVERTLSTARKASIYGEELWRDILTFVRNISIDAENQLTLTYELFSSANKEKRTHALTSLRRLLVSLADALFPAQDVEGLRVGQYLNRLSKFAEDAISSNSMSEIGASELEKRLRQLNEIANKAVHSEVSVFEARQCLLFLQIYLTDLQHIIVSAKRE